MTKYGLTTWVAAKKQNAFHLAENGLYSEEEEHSSCGVALSWTSTARQPCGCWRKRQSSALKADLGTAGC